ncbi:MAG: outer membrane protein assembly factor BamD [bacterium]
MKHSLVYWNFLTVLTLFIACGERESAEELLRQAQTFEQEEKMDEALHAYEKLAKNYADSEYAEEALQKAAFIYYNNVNDFHKAIEYHERLIKTLPESDFVARARFMIGYIYANDIKDYEKAEVAYNEFLQLHPENELVESVKWELDHLGKDVNEQLLDLFGSEESNGEAHLK